MTDNKNLRGGPDRKRVSSQAHERVYLQKVEEKKHPRTDVAKIKEAISKALEVVQPSESRQKIYKEIEKQLKKGK